MKAQEFTSRVASDADMDKLERHGLPPDIVSIPNPKRIGIKDKWYVGHISDPLISIWRKSKGLEGE